jgi:hypothetical protein
MSMRGRVGGLIGGLVLSMAASVVAWAGPFAAKPEAPALVHSAWSLAGDCYPIDFNNIDIQWYAGRGVYQLTVSGMKPYTNMQVSLSHEAYNGRPAYWRTVVIGCVKNGLLMPISAPYYITMTLDRFVGTRGVEIVGANRAVRRAVPRS